MKCLEKWKIILRVFFKILMLLSSDLSFSVGQGFRFDGLASDTFKIH